MRPRPHPPRFVRRSRSSAAAVVAVAGAALGLARVAAAGPGAPAAAEAIVVQESACFDRAQLGAEVDRYLDHPVGAEASVTVRDGPDRLVIEAVSGAVAKDVTGWSCQQRLDFAAVSVSIILGGDYAPRVADAGPIDAAAPLDAGLVGPAPPAPTPPSAAATAMLPVAGRPRVEISAQGGALFEVLPRPAAGIALNADRTLTGPLDLHASILLTSSVSIPFRAAYAETSLLAGLIEGCLARGEALRLRLCAGLAAGRLGVTWAGLAPTSTPSPWFAGAGRFDAHLVVSQQVSFAANLDVFFPIGQQRIDLVDPTLCPGDASRAFIPVCNALAPFSPGRVVETHSLSAAGLMVSVGPVLRFW